MLTTSPSLGAHLSQQQKLSPQLQQSLHILQATALELSQIINQELTVNPVLEAENADISLDQQSTEETLSHPDQTDDHNPTPMGDEWRTWLEQSTEHHPPRNSVDEERRQFLFDSLSSPVTIQEHLLRQLGMVDCTPAMRQLVETLIGSLDDRGFLGTTLEDLALELRLPLTQLQSAKTIIHTFDPPGIGAETLSECLYLQLERDGHAHTLEARIVQHHIDDLAKHRFPHIAKKLGVTTADISRAAEHISTLNPRPASSYSTSPQHLISPDLSVEYHAGKFIVIMNGDHIPRLRISNIYKDLMSQPAGTADVKEYIREKIRSGKFLMRSIDQRQQTIQKIAEEIVHRQADFWRDGPSALKPMTMASVATIVGVHETTVSRAISGKYMATPQGILEMRYFFTAGLSTEGGEELSNTSVKSAIAELIRHEDPTHPLSDEDLSHRLRDTGIQIARRTVAKYREALGLLSSSLRRKY